MAPRQYRRILTPPRGSFFLYGVRGVGKSTWARQTFPDAHIVDLLDEGRHQALLANPALLALELRSLPSHRVVVLDEVQRVPALLNEDTIEIWPLDRFTAAVADRSLWP